MDYCINRARELRESQSPHYNCAQSVLMPFAKSAEVDEEMLRNIAANFGGGMKRGLVCGAVTGGLMALGLMGKDDPGTIEKYYAKLNLNHSNMLDCKDLLDRNERLGQQKKPFCDGLVFECVKLVEMLIGDQKESRI